MAWIILTLSALLEAVWASALGYSEGLSKFWPTVIFLFANLLSLLGLARAMKEIPVGTAYAVWTALGAALTVGYAAITGNEPFSAPKMVFLAGIIGCVVGLKVLSSEKPESPEPLPR